MVAVARPSHPARERRPSEPFDWASVSLNQVLESGARLEASVFVTKAGQAKALIENGRYGYVRMATLVSYCDYPGRFKRAYVSSKLGEKFYLPSQLNELMPRATKYISTGRTRNIDDLRIGENTLLVTRSGTVGHCAIASKALIGGVFSDDVIRVKTHENFSLGYLCAYLKSSVGQTILKSSDYGAVVKHIEPAHLLNLPVPDAPRLWQIQIHHAVMASFRLRDEANALISLAYLKLQHALNLPNVEALEPPANGENGLVSFSVPVTQLDNRLEANYHNPLVANIIKHLQINAQKVLSLGDRQLTQSIILPGRFKRCYVESEYGVPFIGGKEIVELDPRGDKYLSIKRHKGRITDELTLRENMILVTRCGTIGKVNIVPKPWEGWAASEHILRAVPATPDIAGYVYAWLSSEWALPLIRRHTYGAVVFVIDQYQLASVPVPLIDQQQITDINELVLDANEKRYLAFAKEQEAMTMFNKEILGVEASIA